MGMKAIRRYTAQPLKDANLLQQGAGLLNIEGADPASGIDPHSIGEP